ALQSGKGRIVDKRLHVVEHADRHDVGASTHPAEHGAYRRRLAVAIDPRFLFTGLPGLECVDGILESEIQEDGRVAFVQERKQLCHALVPPFPPPESQLSDTQNALRLPIKRGTSRSSPLARILPSPEESLVTLRELPLDLRSTLGAIILVFARRFFA